MEDAAHTNILSMSETYFQLADDTVSAAEEYAKNCTVQLKYIEGALIFVIVMLLLIMTKQSIQALRLRKAVPSIHFVGIYGGDEFIVILRNTTVEEIHSVIHSIQENIDYFNFRSGNNNSKWNLSYSMGYAFSLDYSECTMQILLEKADQNMYIEKKMKKNSQENKF